MDSQLQTKKALTVVASRCPRLVVFNLKFALLRQMEGFLRTAAQRTLVREHRKRKKLLQLADKVELSVRHLVEPTGRYYSRVPSRLLIGGHPRARATMGKADIMMIP